MGKKRKRKIFNKKQDFYSKDPKYWALFALGFLIFFGFLLKVYSFANSESENETKEKDVSELIIFQENTLASLANPNGPPKSIWKLPAVVTAYSSTPGQTDDSPYITAAGTFVREGIVANNYLSFGTEIRIPEIYGDKIFVVEDRMSWKKSNYHIDVWLPEYSQALAFGAQRTYIEVLE